ncbi:hypothetical protein Unana1_04167 [Umbelopsis nana]|jgi:hypothetical protein
MPTMDSESELDLVHVCKTMFTTKPGLPDASWVVYENGTVVFHEKSKVSSKEDLIRVSNEAMSVPVVVGTDTADFGVNRLDVYFPDQPIYAITYSEPSNMATIIEDDGDNDMVIGFMGRQKRRDDCESLVVVATSAD